MHSGAGSRSGQKLVIPRYHPPQNCSAECRLTTIASPHPRLIGGTGGQKVARRWPGGGQEVARRWPEGGCRWSDISPPPHGARSQGGVLRTPELSIQLWVLARASPGHVARDTWVSTTEQLAPAPTALPATWLLQPAASAAPARTERR